MIDRRRRNRSPFHWGVHPIWRGIGCLFLVLIPFLALGVADLIIDFLATTELIIQSSPRELPLIGVVENFWLFVGLTVLLIPLFFVLLSTIGAIVYSLLGGPENERLAEMSQRDEHGYDQRGRH